MNNQKSNISTINKNMVDKKNQVTIQADIDDFYQNELYYEEAQIISDADLDDIMNEKPNFQ